MSAHTRFSRLKSTESVPEIQEIVLRAWTLATGRNFVFRTNDAGPDFVVQLHEGCGGEIVAASNGAVVLPVCRQCGRSWVAADLCLQADEWVDAVDRGQLKSLAEDGLVLPLL